MTYRNESAWIQPAAPTATAAAPRATQARSTAEYRALDAAHHIHPFSDMGALNRAGSRVIVKADGVYLWDSDGNKVID
ncbi:aspartate aminotransferase family protein, partial [Burkholderia cenocepacia]|nr:aspartate aminotransferase family protein [Burkholderia cenocepacia]MCO8382905.1 aspartate aminotransferase family protein [Burkholderia cenocepacia]MCO8396301.1 aspartate aminotransferase family protein [Burkholderia cenocepacia]MCO8402268.1 aspartate aminotransferase family protein [Burkholderia cenocepacia]MCO8417252.1 aspartate aminotransferase family protein [Burkholderia cenocepacia]